jgi:O-antigen/teichoic acid export membrane protein
VKPLYIFGVEPMVQNLSSNYGLYVVFFGLVTLFQFVNDPGIQSYNSIYISNNKESINEYFPKLLGLKLLILPVLTFGVFTAATIIGHDWDQYRLLFGVILILYLSTLFFLLRTSMSAYEYYRVDTWLSSLDRFFLVLVLGYFILAKYPMSVELFVWTQVICYCLCIIIALFFLKKLKINISPKIDLSFVVPYIRASIPYAVIILLTSFITKVDGVMIGKMMTDGIKAAGEYATGLRFIDAANMFGVLFGGLLLPMFSNKLAEGKEIDDVFSLAFRLLLPISLMAGLTFYFYAEDLFKLLYKSELLNNLSAMKILLLSTIPILLSNAMGPIILATKKIKIYNVVLTIAVLFMVMANFIFIPRFGIMASSTIQVCTWTIIVASLVYISQSSGVVNFYNNKLIPKSIFIIFLTMATYQLFTFIDYPWFVEIVIIPAIIGIVALVSNYFSLREILKRKQT